MSTEGTITLERGDGTTLDITPARARPAPVVAEREMHRPPYSTSWFVDGDDLRGHEALDLTIEVHATEALGIAGASQAVEDLLTELTDAALVEVPYGVYQPLGITEWSRSPIEGGYRLQIQLATRGRAADDTGILRLISGPIWELR